MDYLFLAFALVMGIVFAILAYNKDGQVSVPICGALAFIVFWAFFNAVSLNFYEEPIFGWKNPTLWFEASITLIAGAFAGYNNTYEKDKKLKEKGAWRFYFPVVAMIVTIFLF